MTLSTIANVIGWLFQLQYLLIQMLHCFFGTLANTVQPQNFSNQATFDIIQKNNLIHLLTSLLTGHFDFLLSEVEFLWLGLFLSTREIDNPNHRHIPGWFLETCFHSFFWRLLAKSLADFGTKVLLSYNDRQTRADWCQCVVQVHRCVLYCAGFLCLVESDSCEI